MPFRSIMNDIDFMYHKAHVQIKSPVETNEDDARCPDQATPTARCTPSRWPLS